MQQSKKIILLGVGGHCLSVLDSLKGLSSYDEVGLIDKSYPSSNKETSLMGIPVIGDDSDLERLFQEGYTDAFISIGSIGSTILRKRLFERLKKIGFTLPNIIDKDSTVSPYTVLGEGIYIGKKAVVNTDAKIGNGAIINTAAVLEHQCVIGDYVHLAPGSIICGNVTIEEGTHIGAGSVVRQGLHIGADTMIGMGSIVLKDIKSHVTAYGNPCKEVKHD